LAADILIDVELPKDDGALTTYKPAVIKFIFVG
jgi:hypothetical protein